jgi:hypothetical protein
VRGALKVISGRVSIDYSQEAIATPASVEKQNFDRAERQDFCEYTTSLAIEKAKLAI